jgi:hypothetical protein
MVGWPDAAQDGLPADVPDTRRAVLVFRADRWKDAEMLVLRHENAVLRRNIGRVRFEPCGVPEVCLSRELRRCAGCQPHGTTPSSEMASPATILRIVASSVRATVDLRWSAATATRFRPCRALRLIAPALPAGGVHLSTGSVLYIRGKRVGRRAGAACGG